jgi:hypothetical protein
VVVNPDKPAVSEKPKTPETQRNGVSGGKIVAVSVKQATKPGSAKAVKPKTAKWKKNPPQRTQRAQR